MNLVNLLIKDIVQFAADHNLDLNFIIKLIDYRLASHAVNLEDDYELNTYVNNIRIVNALFIMLGLGTQFSEKEKLAYDNEAVIQFLDMPFRLTNYKSFKLELYETYFKDDIVLFEEFISLGK